MGNLFSHIYIMGNNLSFVSVIVPCRNEEKYIGKCLDSILEQDYPKENLEVLVVNGMSTDKTREIIEKFKIQNSKFKIQLIDNPKIITPSAMNIGIKNAKGEIIIKMDAHSVYEKDYISKCVEHLIQSGADNVGGVLKTIPAKNTLTARGIAICLSDFFGAGSSYFRTGSKEPREADAVAFGCYRKEVFQKIGLFDERMAKIEDLELNYRLRKAGGKIMLFPDIKALYYPSSVHLKYFFEHNFTDGIWATYPLKYGFKVSFRHLIPLIFTSGVILALIFSPFSFLSRFLFVLIFGSYLILNLFFSFKIAWREKEFKFLFILPVVFASRHIGYGFGSLYGFLKRLEKK